MTQVVPDHYLMASQVHAKEKQPKKSAAAAAGRGGRPSPGFTDANASWLTPKAPKAAPPTSKAAKKVAAAKAAEIRVAEDEGGYSSDSEDAPLPGELSGGDSDQSGLMSSDDDSEGPSQRHATCNLYDACVQWHLSSVVRGVWCCCAGSDMRMGPGLSMSSDSDEEAAEDGVQPAANGLGDAASSDDDLGELRDDFRSDSQLGSEGDAGGGSGGGSELWSSDQDADTQPGKRAGRLMSAGGEEGSDSDDEDDDDDPLGGAEFSGSDMEASDDEEDDEAALLPSERKAARLDRKRCAL